jgi:hypothetical protein
LLSIGLLIFYTTDSLGANFIVERYNWYMN